MRSTKVKVFKDFFYVPVFKIVRIIVNEKTLKLFARINITINVQIINISLIRRHNNNECHIN